MSDAPAFRFVVEVGPRLVPATAFDAERLSTYQIGSTIQMAPVNQADRPGIRKWWAILRRAVRDAPTPWKTAEQASEAIKLALGIVKYGKTVSGKYMQWPRSLKELDDAELDEAIMQMAEILRELTGVDPLDWPNETPDVGNDDFANTAGVTPPAPAVEGSGDPSPVPAPTSSEAADLAADGDDADEDITSSADPEVVRLMMKECVNDVLRHIGKPGVNAAEEIENIRRAYLEPQNLGSQADFVNKCADTALRVVDKPRDVEKARQYLMGKIA